MPKQHTAPRPTKRPAPYNFRDSTNMVTNMAAWPQNQPGASMAWPDHHLQYHHQQPMMQSYMSGQAVRPPHHSMPMHQVLQPEPVPRPGQSLPWTPEEDNALLEAKSRDMSWDEIHTQYFPNKTGNACRKRHERLQQKARGHWDEARIQRVVTCYNKHRERFWRGVGEQVGERWDEVEKMILQQGFRRLGIARPRHIRNRSRASSGQTAPPESEHVSSSNDEYENADDSGIGLGQAVGHCRRASEIGLATLQQQHSLPGLGHILSDSPTAYKTDGGYQYTG
ncbi:hypothetical protein ABEF92_008103 [Exophiala dermatitidis]|uniref:Myb-like domain-containing protein n=2 Tax=Exophiala dermatitidis TaxID=5970 RepID=H6C7E5_EXODN|nr:uncharacterized protein HMPREF1120_07626 [Exophiala dermatitidis NIH/UT8656]EHY59641.1 hypothetical protein HMPREF1120_07626 [Exophiala dermatitidis NIH/UT8656]